MSIRRRRRQSPPRGSRRESLRRARREHELTRDGDAMGREQRPPRQTRQARRSTIDIRALLTNRDYIKTTAYLLPRGSKVRVLNMMERLRQERRDRRQASLEPQATELPEMTGAELVREINWRIGTLPPDDAEALAQYIRHLTRWRTLRRRRSAAGGSPTASPPRQNRAP